MDLHTELERLSSEDFKKNTPPNESCTCDWVILPLLHSVGYERREIYSRVADGGGKFPDYTILPNQPHQFYLEAKAWGVELQNEHANQSLNYANQNGKRWVVLTNGKNWRLYDNRIEGTAAKKLVAEVSIDDKSDATNFLEAIGKSSMLTVRIEAFVTTQREARKLAANEAKGKALVEETEPDTFTRPKRESTGYAVFIQLVNKPIRRDNLIAGMVKAGFSPSTAESYISWSRRVVDETEMNPFGFQTENFKDAQGLRWLRRKE